MVGKLLNLVMLIEIEGIEISNHSYITTVNIDYHDWRIHAGGFF